MTLTYIAIAVAALALLVARARGKRIARVEDEMRKLGYLEGSLRELRKEMDVKLDLTRRHLALVSQGAKLPADQIVEGKPFADVSAAQGQKMLDDAPGFFVLDVRTPSEYASRHIPGSRLIPVDQLEARIAELPSRETPILVTCAGGSRSAAACIMLAERGYASLYNLATGMNGWRGVTESGAAA